MNETNTYYFVSLTGIQQIVLDISDISGLFLHKVGLTKLPTMFAIFANSDLGLRIDELRLSRPHASGISWPRDAGRKWSVDSPMHTHTTTDPSTPS